MTDMTTAANIAEIAGGIAIFFSLIYAGFQVRQSNRIAKAQSIRSMMSSEFLDQYSLPNVGRALNDFDSLSIDEKWEFHGYFMRLFANYHMVSQTRNLGLIQNSYLEEWARVIACTISPGGRQYWESGAKGALESGSVNLLEEYIKNNWAAVVPYNKLMTWMIDSE